MTWIAMNKEEEVNNGIYYQLLAPVLRACIRILPHVDTW